MDMLIQKTRVFNGKRVKVWVGNPKVSSDAAKKRLDTILTKIAGRKARKASA
jgi:hypothetical protein